MQRFITVLLLVLTASWTLGAQDAEWYVDKPITGIEFEGLSSVSENELLGLMRPYLGRPYTDSLSWDIQGKLYALDYFDLIVPEIRPGTAGRDSVTLVFQVKEKPLVDDIEFVGNSKARRGELLDTILIKEEDLLNPGSLRIDEQAIIDLYLEKGFIDAEVVSEYDIDERTNRATVVFRINEGTQTKISEIRFVGNDVHIADSSLQNVMSTKAQSLFSKGLFVETKLQEDLKAIERFYGDQGFIDASIVDVKKDIVFDSEDELNKMVITIVIEEGDAWTYGGMEFLGNRIYSDEELREMVSQENGATFNRTKFQLDYQRVTDLYYENGYIFNTFTYEEERDPADRVVSYAVNIVERDRAHIENIIIRGNEKTKTYVIRREIPLEEGEVFSKSKIFDGVMNLYNLQYFDNIEPNPYPGSIDGLMDLVIDVQEGKTSDIGFGLSFSGGGEFPVAGQLSWNDRNFLGRGQTLGAEVNVSPDAQSGSLTFTEPRILGRRWLGSVDLTIARQKNSRVVQDRDGNRAPDPFPTWEAYDEAGGLIPEDNLMEYLSKYLSMGFSTGYTWVTRFGRLGLSTGLRFAWEKIEYNDDVYTPLNYSIQENLDTWKYSDTLSLKVAWDTRDLQFDPTKGFILSQSISYAGLIRNVSNKNYIKSVSRFNYNLKLLDIPYGDEEKSFKTILYFNTAFNALFDKPWIEYDGNIADTDGFTIDGMFIGRGWPITSSDRYRYMWDNTLQLKFPMVPNILAFDIFLDAVGGWRPNDGGSPTKIGDWNGEDWKFSLGAGLRFANPQFPIGIYLVKRFQWQDEGFTWFPDAEGDERYEFAGAGLDLVIAFDMDIY